MSRKKVIAGNWKMNKTSSETTSFIKELAEELKMSGNKTKVVAICAVPTATLESAVKAAKGTRVKIAAQNMHYEDKGAFTGEISADMLKDINVNYVIIGHSERREYYNETDDTVNKKVLKAIEKGLTPIICVGESLEQRQSGVTAEFVQYQVKYALKDVDIEDMKNIIFAYEPIWAIGTGQTATVEQADEVCGIIRKVIQDKYSRKTANAAVIQYGGSMNDSNAKDLLSMPNIDGGLVGGASLKVKQFMAIINYDKI